MASPSQILKLLVQADVDGAVAGLKKVGAAADKDLGKAETQAEQTSARLTKMGAASLAAGAVMATALYSTIGPASDLAEAVNVTGLTFGESAAEMEKWADGAAEAFGQSKRQALEGASAIGGLLNNVGFLGDESADLSRKLVVLASDMASAFNTDPAQALEALRSGLAGQSEPLRAYNVFLSDAAIKQRALEEGIWDGVGAMDEHEKALARLSIIMEQTSSIQGDFANTATEAANAERVLAAQMEDLKASVGQAVLPIFQEVVGVLNTITGAFNGLPGPVQGVIAKLLVLGAGLTLLSGGFLTALGRVRDLRAEWGRLSAASPRLAAGIGVAGTAIAAAAFALDQYNNAAREQAAKRDAVADAWGSAATEADRFVQAIQGIADADKGGINVVGVLDELGLTTGHVQKAWRDASGDADAFYDSLEEMAGGAGRNVLMFTGLFNALEDGINAFEESGRVADTSAGQIGGLAGSVDSAYRNATNASGAMDSFGSTITTITPPVRDLADAVDDVNSALDRYFGTILSASQLESEFQQAMADSVDALVDANGAIDANKVTMDASTEAGRENIDNLDNFIGVIGDTVEAMTNQGKSQDEIRAKLRGMISDYRDNMEAAGLNEAQVAELTEALNGVPAEVITKLENEGYDDALAQAIYLRDLYNSIPRNITTTYSVVGLTGTPGYSTPPAEDTSGPTDFTNRPGKKRSAPTGFDGGDGAKLPDIHVYIDGRDAANSLARWSERTGGLPIKIRGGQ